MLNSLHRHCVWLQANWTDWLPELLAFQSTKLAVVTDDEELATNIPFGFVISTSKAKQLLGQTLDILVLDVRWGLSLSQLSLLAGCVRGGGIFALYTGNILSWLKASDHQLDRYLPWPLTSAQVPQPYKQLFYRALQQGPFTDYFPTTIPEFESESLELTPAQQTVQNSLTSTPVTLLLAARGRGKSTLLGAAAAYWQQQHYSVAVCAASRQQTLAGAEQFEQSRQVDSPFPFFSPDNLLASTQHFDLLLIDEAASLPVPVLVGLLSHGKHVVFCSTNDGYEGSGKGFGIKFRQYLRQQGISFIEHNLLTPTRWGENDPLELWLEALLFSGTMRVAQKWVENTLNIQAYHSQQWLEQTDLLDQTFSLLVNAHYQTTPDNKRWLVDDPSATTFIATQQGQVVGVCLTTSEGELPRELALQIEQGSRRPRGHLFPQSMLAHGGYSDAYQYRYWRVSRIAVSQAHQRHGIGSALIAEIQSRAVSANVDMLCTSFAFDKDVLAFWQSLGFSVVRVGVSKDKSSGTYSIMMARAIKPAAQQSLSKWVAEFRHHFVCGLPLRVQDLDLVSCWQLTQPLGEATESLPLSDTLRHHLGLFAHYSRPLETVQTLLWQALQPCWLSSNRTETILLLTRVAFGEIHTGNCQQFGFKGKKDFIEQARQNVAWLLSTYEK